MHFIFQSPGYKFYRKRGDQCVGDCKKKAYDSYGKKQCSGDKSGEIHTGYPQNKEMKMETEEWNER